MENPPPVCLTLNMVIVACTLVVFYRTLGLHDLSQGYEDSLSFVLLFSFYKGFDCSRSTDAAPTLKKALAGFYHPSSP